MTDPVNAARGVLKFQIAAVTAPEPESSRRSRCGTVQVQRESRQVYFVVVATTFPLLRSVSPARSLRLHRSVGLLGGTQVELTSTVRRAELVTVSTTHPRLAPEAGLRDNGARSFFSATVDWVGRVKSPSDGSGTRRPSSRIRPPEPSALRRSSRPRPRAPLAC